MHSAATNWSWCLIIWYSKKCLQTWNNAARSKYRWYAVVVEGTVDVCREHMAMLQHHTNLSHSGVVHYYGNVWDEPSFQISRFTSWSYCWTRKGIGWSVSLPWNFDFSVWNVHKEVIGMQKLASCFKIHMLGGQSKGTVLSAYIVWFFSCFSSSFWIQNLTESTAYSCVT
jgi:hypothetical protein